MKGMWHIVLGGEDKAKKKKYEEDEKNGIPLMERDSPYIILGYAEAKGLDADRLLFFDPREPGTNVTWFSLESEYPSMMLCDRFGNHIHYDPKSGLMGYGVHYSFDIKLLQDYPYIHLHLSRHFTIPPECTSISMYLVENILDDPTSPSPLCPAPQVPASGLRLWRPKLKKAKGLAA